MTIKWVQVDPLVMNGEPFCYGSRVTVRQLLEMRAGGYDLTRILTDHPELRRLGVAAAFCYAADHRERYAEFFGADGVAGRARLHGRGGGRAPRGAASAGGRRRRVRRRPEPRPRPPAEFRPPDSPFVAVVIPFPGTPRRSGRTTR